MDFGSLNTMVPSGRGPGYSRTGYNGVNRFWDPNTNMPCNQPPWGRLFAINVNTGDIAWQMHHWELPRLFPRTGKKPEGPT